MAFSFKYTVLKTDYNSDNGTLVLHIVSECWYVAKWGGSIKRNENISLWENTVSIIVLSTSSFLSSFSFLEVTEQKSDIFSSLFLLFFLEETLALFPSSSLFLGPYRKSGERNTFFPPPPSLP